LPIGNDELTSGTFDDDDDDCAEELEWNRLVSLLYKTPKLLSILWSLLMKCVNQSNVDWISRFSLFFVVHQTFWLRQ
jgi:hypothetical protein